MANITTLAAAVAAIAHRSDEITTACEKTASKDIRALFSIKGIRVTNDICLSLLAAVAAATGEELAATRPAFEDLREHVCRANDALAARLHETPEMMHGINACENLGFDLLCSGHEALPILAAVAAQNARVIRAVLTAAFADIAAQLDAADGHRFSLRHMMCKVLNLFGEHLLNQMKEILAAHTAEVKLVARDEGAYQRRMMVSAFRKAENHETGCHHPKPDEDKYVQRVVARLATDGVTFSIYEACNWVWHQAGLVPQSWLYGWCHGHENDIRDAVKLLKQTRSARPFK